MIALVFVVMWALLLCEDCHVVAERDTRSLL